MKILVTGGNTVNKGAHLMLIAFSEQVRQHFPEAELYLSSTVPLTGQLKQLAYRQLAQPIFLFTSSERLFNLALRFPVLAVPVLRFVYGKTFPKGQYRVSDMDVIFDISGFSFGDKWGATALKNLGSLVAFGKRKGIPIVLMPQALGPFTDPQIREAAEEAFADIDLVFARDAQSFRELRAIKKTAVKDQKPDITLILHAKEQWAVVGAGEEYVCIVPNVRMLDKAHQSWRENYMEYLSRAIQLIEQKSAQRIIVLAHCNQESEDYRLCTELVAEHAQSGRVELFHDDDPLVLKSVLAGAELLIGSRFHALASALSSNVPSVGTSWNHKYEELLGDFGCEEYSHNRADESFFSSIQQLLEPATREEVRGKLRERNQLHADLNQQMWRKIASVVEG